ncbi:UDP-glucosyltransferase 2 [Frankliniella fusca]|uniref:UDP-glucuronosyltransferase n=1 Tax=Frankliniella fusca TaxID=407009 RepID=A0AAE1HDU3_9NEOP|nr:UDP-glucosyltransferase 2 [Frankliniella fusca]
MGPRGALPPLVLALLLVCCCGPAPAAALRVLALYPLAAHSHFLMFKGLMEGLVEHGHEVVLFSPFPNKTPRANWTDVDTSLGRPNMVSSFTFDLVASPSWSLPGSVLKQALDLINFHAGSGLCRDVFSMPDFQRAMDGGLGRFDVVLTELFGSDCWAAVPYKLGVPLVSVSSAPDVAWMHERIGSVDNPSYITNVFGNAFGRMSLWERVCNTFTGLYLNYLARSYFQDGSDPVVREFFGPDVPPLRDLVRNTSLVLLNRHVSLHAARPVVPNLVLVGGLHVRAPPGTMDPGLRAWMDGAQHGVIFFSMGSLIKGASIPPRMRDALLGAFAELPQRVVWKWEDEGLQVPANVRVAKWLPQMDILTHPKTVLFITHGGLMGTLEAVHSSVPMLGLPLFADQITNTELYMSLGIAEKLNPFDLDAFTKDNVLAKLRQMTEPRYRERAREIATLFRDRPRAALDEAVWWIEYVVRNRGAPHLRPFGADLPLYQYLLLDVVAVVLASATLAVALVACLVRRALRGARPAPSKAAAKKTN